MYLLRANTKLKKNVRTILVPTTAEVRMWGADISAPAWLIMQESLSSWVKSLPPLSLSMCLKCISLKAFSLEQLPHIIVVTCVYTVNSCT